MWWRFDSKEPDKIVPGRNDINGIKFYRTHL